MLMEACSSPYLDNFITTSWPRLFKNIFISNSEMEIMRKITISYGAIYSISLKSLKEILQVYMNL